MKNIWYQYRVTQAAEYPNLKTGSVFCIFHIASWTFPPFEREQEERIMAEGGADGPDTFVNGIEHSAFYLCRIWFLQVCQTVTRL